MSTAVLSVIGTQIKSFWSNNKKTIIIILLLLICFWVLKRYFNAKAEKQQISDILKHKDDSLIVYKDKNGVLNSKISEIQGNADVIKQVYGKTIDSLAGALKIKSSQIQEYIQIVTSTKGNFKAKIDTVIKRDTINNGGDFAFGIVSDTSYPIKFDDGYLSLNALYTTQGDSIKGSYKFNDQLTVTSFYERHGLLKFLGIGRKDYFLNASSTNPNCVVTGLRNFRVVTESNKKISIGPNISVIYNKGVQVVVGIGIQYSLIKF